MENQSEKLDHQTSRRRPRAAGAGRVHFLSPLNRHLRPFLAKWHPALLAWENQQQPDGKKSEAEWPDAAKCREELEQIRKAMRENVRRLGALIGVQHLDEILSDGP